MARVPGARGAIFCDYEGENVELFLASPPPAGCPELSEFDMKICGAHVAAPLARLREADANPLELRLLCTKGALLCRMLPDGYYVALLLAAPGRSAVATLRLAETARLVAAEM